MYISEGAFEGVSRLDVSDSELMRKVKESDDLQAFDELVLRYRKSAVAFAARYTGDYYLAEDLAQEAFARIYVKKKQYKVCGEFRPYLFQVLRNICIDHHRARVRKPEEMLPEGLPDTGVGPEDVVIQQEAYGIIGRIFRVLDEHYQTVLYLQEYEGLSYEEIAKILGMTVGQVRMLLYRGRKKFKKLAEKELNGT